METIRMGVIGLGNIASNIHIPGILKSPNAELFAICEPKKDLLDSKAEAYGITKSRCYSDYVDILKNPDVDAISICTPNSSHYEIAMAAVKYGKPFAIEKPLAMNQFEAKEIKEAVGKENICCMICFSYRFKAAIRYARWLIKEGHLGDIRHIYVQYLQGWGNHCDVPLTWRYKKEVAGSGAVGDLGVHMIDITRFLVGDFVKVSADGGLIMSQRKLIDEEGSGSVTVDDYCHFLARLENGVSASYGITRYAFGRGNYQRIEIYGSKGGLVYKLDEPREHLEICIGDIYAGVRDYHEISVPDHFKSDQMQSFFDLLNGKGDGLEPNIEDGYISQVVLDSVVDSFDKEKWIYINKKKEK